jgi:hypothetical protein
MPFPPGVGGGRVIGDAQSYEVITADKALGESNVGNRMLRNMGWQEGSVSFPSLALVVLIVLIYGPLFIAMLIILLKWVRG